MGFPPPPRGDLDFTLPWSDLAEWDAQFERETGKRVAVLLQGPCVGHVYAFGSDRCQRCGEPAHTGGLEVYYG